MRITVLLAFISALMTASMAVVHAQESREQMPSCALNCVATIVPQSSCTINDTQCVCLNKRLLNQLAACAVSNCTIKEALTAQNISSTTCGVPIRNHTLITPVVSTIFGSLAIVAVILRIFSRLPMLPFSFGLDDTSILLSLACIFPPMVYTWIFRDAGLGRDIWTISFDDISRVLFGFFLSEIFYFGATTFAKCSILLFYRRVFPSGSFHKCVYVVMTVSLCYGFVYIIVATFQCLPVSYAWTRWDGEHSGMCIDVNAATWAASAINISIDLTIIIIPMPMLVRLNLSRRKKVQVVAMFSVGLFVTIVSVVRLVSLVKWAKSPNFTYDSMPTIYWSQIESEMGVICACMPGIRALLSHLFPNLFGSTNANSEERTVSPTKIPRNLPFKVSVTQRSDETDLIELIEEQ